MKIVSTSWKLESIGIRRFYLSHLNGIVITSSSNVYTAIYSSLPVLRIITIVDTADNNLIVNRLDRDNSLY